MNQGIPVKYVFIILALGSLIYVNTLRNEFVSDDIPAIVNNPDISKLSFNGNLAAFSNSLNYRIGGFNPVVYHLTNLGLHLANSILVFLFLRLFFNPSACFWAALIFAAHPIHTEAVTWISGRPYSGGTFLLLASFLLYLKGTSGPRVKLAYFLPALLMFAGALFINTSFLVSLFLFILYDLVFARWQRTWKYWFLFIALAGIRFLYIFGDVRGRIASLNQGSVGQGTSNLAFNAVYSFFSHLWLILWPMKLTLYHEPCNISVGMLMVGGVLLVGLILLLPKIFKKSKAMFFAILLFALFLAPTYSPVMISWLVAERYVYFPSIAFSMLIAFLIDSFSVNKKISRFIYVFLAILIVFYSGRTIIRNADWSTHASIWRATVRVSPLSPKAHNNMGDVYSREGNLSAAAGEFSRATELRSDYWEAYHNLANTYQKMGMFAQADLNYRKAVELNPSFYQPINK
ncbi:MAG: tetratricopeptide repeat protein [Candidatus Omnitrophota bacterium]